jgi:hypothetical protein
VSGQGYEVLHYRRDVTGWDTAQPGRILGHDEFGRPYEVIDAEYEPCDDCDGEGTYEAEDDDGRVYGEEPCPTCQGKRGRTVVQLQYATPENIAAHIERAARP